MINQSQVTPVSITSHPLHNSTTHCHSINLLLPSTITKSRILWASCLQKEKLTKNNKLRNCKKSVFKKISLIRMKFWECSESKKTKWKKISDQTTREKPTKLINRNTIKKIENPHPIITQIKSSQHQHKTWYHIVDDNKHNSKPYLS